MIALIFLIISFIAGWSIVQLCFPKLSLLEQAALAWVIALIGTTWIALIASALGGFVIGLWVTSLICAAIGWKWFSWSLVKKAKLPSTSEALFLLGWVVFFLLLFNQAFLPRTRDGLTTVVYTYGDIALHATFIQYFSQQTQVNLTSPIFSSQVIQYPFLVDFHTALLVKTGLSIHWALVLTSLLTIVSACVFLYHFTYEVVKKAIAPVLASCLLFFNGGAFGWRVLNDWHDSHLSFWRFLFHLPQDYTLVTQKAVVWSNIITTHLLPQQGFLFGFTFFLAFLRIWQIVWYSPKIKLWQLVCISLLVSLTPLFHSYTYLVTAPLLIWLTFWLFATKKVSFPRSLLIIAPLLLSIPQVFYLANGKHFLALQLGWLSHENLVSFWWRNMGVGILFLAGVPILFLKIFPKRKFEILLLAPFIAIFLICNVFIFQPYDWDNMKFFLLSFSYIAMLTGVLMAHYWQNIQYKSAICAITGLACLSGVLSLLFVTQTNWQIASVKDIQLAEVIKHTPPAAIFLTANSHNHVVPMLSGRAVVMGYDGWLWSHGVLYDSVANDVAAMYAGASSATQLISTYHINYIFIGPEEQKKYQINTQFFENRFAKFYQDREVTIYKVN